MLSQPHPLHPRTIHAGQAGSGVRHRIARRASENGGFTMIELMIVVLIIGVLATIAIPSFLSTTARANDAQAKVLVRSAETTAEAIGVDHGSYASVTATELAAQEPTIPITASTQHAYLSNATAGEHEYSVTVTATDGDELTIAKSNTGTISRTCHSPILKTGCDGGESSSW